MNVRNAVIGTLVAGSLWCAGAIHAQTNVRVGWCARTISSAAAPFAIAQKMGWYAADGITVQLVPLPGSGDCTKFVATREVLVSLASIEPLAILHPQGTRARIYYTAYQGNVYGIAVPAGSPIKSVAELRGKRIGLISMASAGAIVARALVSEAGMNPDTDVSLVVAGEGAQTAALIRSKQVDALSQFDTQYAMVENAGIALRRIETPELDRYPSNGFLALDDVLAKNKKELVAVARGYAMGTIFAINNPEAAIRILWEVYPQTKPTGKEESVALRDDIKTLEARAVNWRPERVGAKRWGESVEKNYAAYLEYLLKWGVIKERVQAKDIITNDWLSEIVNFDPAKMAALAKGYRYK
jgi:NitT/TauT family transport system substrate-binding protein